MIPRIEAEVRAAMKSGDARRRDTLRLVLSSLKSAEKDAREDLSDEAALAVLRRERKRRIEAADAYRAGGAEDRAALEEAEAVVIDEFLPTSLGDDEIAAIVDQAIAETGATSPKEMGSVMRVAMAKTGGRADGKVVQAAVRARAHRLTRAPPETSVSFEHVARLTFPVSNELAHELGSDRDRILTALAERLGCAVHLRGNEVLVEGPDDRLGRAAIVIEELGALVEQGLAIGPQTVEALGGVLDAGVSGADVLHDVVWRHRGKKIAPKTLNQKRYVDAIRRATVTFGIGPAGTGKTYLAMALAVAALVDREVSRIILTRPAVEAGEHLGFLPGDMQAKVDPYLRPLFDAVYDMLDADRLQTSLEKGLIEVAPLAFMRGRTLNDSFIILDEAQNTTPEQMQMFLTRLGFNSKMVVTGDVTQTDLKGGQRSGLVDVDQLLRGIPDIEFVAFGSEDVVRHKLVARIVSAYNARAEASQRVSAGQVGSAGQS